jgi:hypothetical protein
MIMPLSVKKIPEGENGRSTQRYSGLRITYPKAIEKQRDNPVQIIDVRSLPQER